MNILHSSRSDRWFTPLDILVRAKAVLGNIDCDPASEELANARVGATRYLTQDGELESSTWLLSPGTVWLNPPGNKKGNKSLTGLFWKRLMQEVDSGNVTHAIFMAFSVEALQHTQRLGCDPMAAYPLCIPKKRIAFDLPDGRTGSAPSHSNAIVYVPGTVKRAGRFEEQFEDLGYIMNVGDYQ